MYNNPGSDYLRQVFINCPFDAQYWPLFQAVTFVVTACGFTPRCALEASDAGEERLSKILRIIEDCHLGIHDLSRKGPDAQGGLPRFNMSFEMGLFQGAAHFSMLKKSMLVMEAHPFEYQKFISDISGRDIKHHDNDTRQVIPIVREWLNSQRIEMRMIGGHSIVSKFERFMRQLPKLLRAAELQPSEVAFPHFLNWSELVYGWLGSEKSGPA